jgi:hypothetical protein
MAKQAMNLSSCGNYEMNEEANGTITVAFGEIAV